MPVAIASQPTIVTVTGLFPVGMGSIVVFSTYPPIRRADGNSPVIR